MNKEKFEDLLKVVDEGTPEIGSKWTHRNGNKYEVLLITNLHSDEAIRYPKNIVYRGENGYIWSRLLSDWHRSFTKI